MLQIIICKQNTSIHVAEILTVVPRLDFRVKISHKMTAILIKTIIKPNGGKVNNKRMIKLVKIYL